MTQAVRAAPQGSPMTAVLHAMELTVTTAARSEGTSGGGRRRRRRDTSDYFWLKNTEVQKYDDEDKGNEW